MKVSRVDFMFDHSAWAAVLRQAETDGLLPVLAEMSGQTETHLSGVGRGKYAGTRFPFPAMSNFINICNLLDLDPRSFFILED